MGDPGHAAPASVMLRSLAEEAPLQLSEDTYSHLLSAMDGDATAYLNASLRQGRDEGR